MVKKAYKLEISQYRSFRLANNLVMIMCVFALTLLLSVLYDGGIIQLGIIYQCVAELTLVILLIMLRVFNLVELRIFSLVYLVFTLFLIVTSCFYPSSANHIFPYQYSDQLFFYKQAKLIIPYLSTLPTLFTAYSPHLPFRYQFIYHVINGSLNFSSYLFTGEFGSPVFFKFFNIFVGAVSSVVVYKILCMFFDRSRAVKYCLTFAFLSPLFFVSQLIMRDTLNLLVFAIAALYYLKPVKMKNLVILILLLVVLSLIRLESAVILAIILLYYSMELLQKHLNIKFSKSLFIMFFSILAVSIGSYLMLGGYFIRLVKEIYFYYNLGLHHTTDSSLIKIAYDLPLGLNLVGLFVFGVLKPFPFWFMSSSAPSTVGYFLTMLPLKVSVVFSLVMLVYAAHFHFMKLKRCINSLFVNRFIFLSKISVIYLVLSSLNYSQRREMMVYPVIYLLAFMVINNMTSRRSRLVWISVLSGYFMLNILYFVIK